ncbi:MAG: RpiB/LacA/LacB family sugar-phosphate isomerase, partial [Kiritimatiellae bacterium]|nr:RpiB/LacA/LacB family sugar-phosphate isomerase [Kiritimatiellia bacterium]
MQIIIACDHGGLSLKQGIADYLKGTAHTLEDLGTFSDAKVDYPDFAVVAAERIVEKKADAAVLICTTGIGMCVTANRFAGVRAALCATPEAAAMTRAHNDANVLVLAGTLTPEAALAVVKTFFETPF